MDTTVLNRQKGSIKAQIMRLITYLSEEAAKANEIKLNGKLGLILKLEIKFDELKVEYYKILQDEQLEEYENEFLEIDDSIQDIKYVCMGSTPDRMEKFAHMVREDLDIILPTGATLCDLAIRSYRYSLFKTGPVLSVSHGMGISSLSIVLHEILKLLYYAQCSNVIFIRMGSCGGIDVRTGSLMITDEVVDGMLRPYLKLDVLGKSVQRAAVLDKEIANELKTVAEDEISECKSFIGKTMSTFDFYEGQARLDGAFCEYTKNEKMAYLQSLQAKGIKNIEMESLAFAAMCHHAGVKCAVVCVVLLDRLLDDQIPLSSEIVEVYKDRPLRLVSKFIRKRHGSTFNFKNCNSQMVGNAKLTEIMDSSLFCEKRTRFEQES